jgi:energy-coupling factor transporter ATP-binding protein EcfA2
VITAHQTDSGIEAEIVSWAATRPGWQQSVMRRLADGAAFADDEVDQLATLLVVGSAQDASPLTVQDVPGAHAAGDCVALTSIRNLTNINALLEDQELTFGATGLTVVYGDNGSGKSGYARLLKDAVGARHSATVHGHVFAESSDQAQGARIAFTRSGVEADCSWPAALDPALRAVAFYDEACGNAYIMRDSDLTFRPGALELLDGLIVVCGAVRAVLDSRLTANALAQGNLPTAAAGTAAARFIEELSATVTSDQVAAACALPNDSDEQLAALIQEEARLRSTDPSQERRRLQKLADETRIVSTHLIGLAAGLGEAAGANLERLRLAARERRAAAVMASHGAFDAEPVAGVGSESWRALWEAARSYSEKEAFHEHRFPMTGADARCLLCHQTLDVSAADRLARFDVFMSDTTARSAREAEDSFNAAIAAIRDVEVSPATIATKLVELEAADGPLARRVSDWLEQAEKRQAALLESVRDGRMEMLPLFLDPAVAELDASSLSLQAAADEIDTEQFQQQSRECATQKDELEGRIALAKQRSDVEAEIERLAQKARLEAARRQVDTGQISRKATELTEAHVTAMVHDWFARESDRLRLERVVLKRSGGQKGRLRHRPTLLNATIAQPVHEVLSEGEQTALGLAGFFTEAHFDASRSALVLDDPVTSLDHIRRALVAARLAELATDRQVIVFTHDVSFVGALRRAARIHKVALTERTVQRRGQRHPGLLSDQHPWKAKDVPSRLNELETGLARIRRGADRWDQEGYENECAGWAGRLSETWERLIHLEIVNLVVDRDLSEVKPAMVTMLSRITEEDDREFQASYHRCSGWVRRHDKAPDVNYVAPSVAELEQELGLIRAWFKRIKSYR